MRFFAAIGIVVVIVICILFGAAIIGRMNDGNSVPRQASSTPTSQAVSEHVIPVSPETYWSQYHRNEVRADSIYRDHAIRMTSIVESINKDFTDSVYLVFPVENMFQGIQAHMKESQSSQAGSLSIGDRVTVLCTGGQMVVGTPMLKDCVFSEEPAPFPAAPSQRQAASTDSEVSQTIQGTTAVYRAPKVQQDTSTLQAQSSAISDDEFEDGFLEAMKPHWQVPAGALPGTSAEMVVYISADGTVTSRVETPSGNPALDQSCTDAIMQVGKYRPTPRGNTVTLSFSCKVNP